MKTDTKKPTKTKRKRFINPTVVAAAYNAKTTAKLQVFRNKKGEWHIIASPEHGAPYHGLALSNDGMRALLSCALALRDNSKDGLLFRATVTPFPKAKKGEITIPHTQIP